MSDLPKHLASFNLFREADGQLYVTIVEAKGVQEELGISAGAVPLHIPTMQALFEAVRQTQARAIQSPISPTPEGRVDRE